MAGLMGVAEMEMEMEMEMDAGPSIPLPLASPVVRPIGVSPVSQPGRPDQWYRGNKWPPASRPAGADGLLGVPELTNEWKNGDSAARLSAKNVQWPLPLKRQWAAQFYSIAVLGEFVSVNVGKEREPKWDSIDLTTEFPEDVTAELQQLVRLIDYRANVLSEALAQRNGIDNYFRGILSFTQSSHPCTFGLMQIALHVGEFQVMHYKYKFDRPRASQLCPWLMPPIEVPGHASYPSGHATQAHLVALILGEVMPPPVVGPGRPLRLLAHRVARNREVLGLHYPSDSRAGAKLARESYPLLLECPTVKVMRKTARREWGCDENDNPDRTALNIRGLG